MGIDREPLLRDLKRTSERLMLVGSLRFHSIVVRGRWVLCGCAPDIRGQSPWNALRRNARKYDKWAQ